MKFLFWLGITGLVLFEIALVYFIMPLPGSQVMNSIDAAYFLHKSRWIFRIVFVLMLVAGLFKTRFKRKWLLAFPLVIAFAVIYMTNFVMSADKMFYQPESKLMVKADLNKVDSNRLVIGVIHNGDARAYPIQFMGYHHQLQDTVGGKPMLITYCTVCRTGRVFDPFINGKHEKFRLVGMDHFNALFEDQTTKSWWRQVNGEAVAGKLKGQLLKEVFSTQTSLSQWLSLNPNSLVMQADQRFLKSYDSTGDYETGKSRKRLTGTDSTSWGKKSWVIGVKAGGNSKAYDWNVLKQKRIIHDGIGSTPILLVLANDDKSFFAFELPSPDSQFFLSGDTLTNNQNQYLVNGKGINANSLKALPAYQEFWHSWQTFNPNTTKYN